MKWKQISRDDRKTGSYFVADKINFTSNVSKLSNVYVFDCTFLLKDSFSSPVNL